MKTLDIEEFIHSLMPMYGEPLNKERLEKLSDYEKVCYILVYGVSEDVLSIIKFTDSMACRLVSKFEPVDIHERVVGRAIWHAKCRLAYEDEMKEKEQRERRGY